MMFYHGIEEEGTSVFATCLAIFDVLAGMFIARVDFSLNNCCFKMV